MGRKFPIDYLKVNYLSVSPVAFSQRNCVKKQYKLIAEKACPVEEVVAVDFEVKVSFFTVFDILYQTELVPHKVKTLAG